ncbi:protein ENHANCED DOWNY MILDEW 2-like isoform X2 [Cornus florida]|uniref:protein ENHANCED DOWNY MILDEW 2-like isoform X2 n=1 Tax=Cornus florida TaxID=4283 RepID=UPI00289AFF3E|nr:protein ENHANCED DOWNY MILDEW 2-like isoform X2 [Cornus florida]
MASSDEDGEIVPDHVTNYLFVNCKKEPISFSSLPLQWCEDEIPNGSSMQIFLYGSADDGLQKIYKKVIAWKFELSYVLPEIYVLTKDRTWIKLQRPRKSFEDTIKTILITVHFLHFMKKNPGACGYAIWNHLSRAFSSYEVKPSENDLLDHMPLINEAAMRDKDVAKSEYLANFLLEMPGKRKASHEENVTTKKSKFIVDAYNEDNDDDDDNDVDDDNNDECDGNEDGLFDTVCAFCDNGGELLCCEGCCMRSFHPTKDSGVETVCDSLGYSDAEVEAIQNFLCKNCQHQRHQCFICGMLGSSNKTSGAEVFPCVSATCGHFYHPKCVAELLHPRDDTQAEELKKNIASGESFTCPAHKCYVCKQGEEKKVFDLQFALCRRCPKAYHRKCLPREITFECTNGTDIQQRAWDGLLPNRTLIYCMDHKIILEIGTPERNHVLFPDIDVKKKQHSLVLSSSKEKVVTEEISMVSGNVRERNSLKMQKQVEKVYSAVKGGDCTNKTERGFSGQGFEPKTKALTLKSLKDNNMSSGKTYMPSAADKSKSSLNQSNSLLTKRSYLSKEQNNYCGKTENKIASKPVKKMASNTQPLRYDTEVEKRVLGLMKNSSASFNMEEFVMKQRRLSGRAYSSRFAVDKNITMGKVEGAVQAVRTALKKLQEGCAIEDAKAVCEPEILEQLIRWKRKLSVYLAPFLHRTRYTSFGRHFTKVDKLKEIVDRLHWYAQDGDMIVDFCCGSNDFSCLMKEKLDKMGKRCSFKNFDIIPPKNKFNFKKRDWMKVRLGELPVGPPLIMGLNPPFGVQASLANKFIDKALMFKPKLLILIVPKAAQRLEEKEPPYDIIWEDDRLLSGKSFYLPGSVDVHNQPHLDQWNLEPPPLYLWSRPDWTAKHKAIAHDHGHSYKKQNEMPAEGNNVELPLNKFSVEENHDRYGDFSNIMNGYGDIGNILYDVPEELYDTETKATVLDKPVNSQYFGDGSCGWNNLSEYPNEMQDEGKDIFLNEASQMGKLDSGEPLLNEEDMCVDMDVSTPTTPTYSPPNNTDLGNYFEDKPYVALDTPTKMITTEEGLHHLQPSFSGHHSEFGTENTSFPNATEGEYGQMNETFPYGTYWG